MFTLTPKAISVLTRWAKVTIFGALALAVGGLIQIITGNGLELGPTAQSIVVAISVPILAALEKWATWQTKQ